MTSDVGEDGPRLPLLKEFGIFCFGWVGAIGLVFLLALMGFEEGDKTLTEFLYECRDVAVVLLAVGVIGFVGAMILFPILVKVFVAVDWFGKILLSLGVGLSFLILIQMA